MNNASNFSQKQADHIARMFNVGFNSAMLYGGDHPTTRKNVDPFVNAIISELATTPVISIIVDRESLFIDEFCTDKAINPKRIVSQLSKSGIKSVTFEYGVRQSDIYEFFRLAGDNKAIHPADQIQSTMQSNNCRGIRLNHVRYGKITADETLVSLDKINAIDSSIKHPGNGTLSQSAREEIERIISLAKLIEQPHETAATLLHSITDEKSVKATVQTLSRMRTEINNAEPQSIESLLNAVFELKMDLSEALAAQKLTGKILSSTEPVRKQMDHLTSEVLAKLVKEEYRNGDVSLQRLAQIIRRMLPDLSELKCVLPLLKNTLLSEGMPLSDYIQLIRFIDLEVESESIATLLGDAATGIGVGTADIIKAIKAEPNEAAKLMFLAAEIRQGTNLDDAQLSVMLTEYIEKVSSSIALDSHEISGPQGGLALEKILFKIENQLVDKLGKYGIDEPTLLKVKSMLEKQFSTTYNSTAAQWMTQNIAADQGMEISDLAIKLTSFVGQEQLFSKFKEPLIEALRARGLGPKDIEEYIKHLSNHISAGKKIVLPADALSPNNMLFLLNRELKQQHRYNTSFSTLLISVKKITEMNGMSRAPQLEDLKALIPRLFVLIKPLLRDIDLIGSLGGKDEHMVITLLTLTNEIGAAVVQNRIMEKILATEFNINQTMVHIEPIVSISSPVNGVAIDLQAYLTTIRTNHARGNSSPISHQN